MPESGFLWVTERMKNEIDMPIIATNRFNHFDKAEKAILDGKADFVSMARPFLADAELVNKYEKKQYHQVNTCIACNQACLDHIFQAKPASCLVNPEAGKTLVKSEENAHSSGGKKIVVVGGGPAGLSFAYYASGLGHNVELIEKENEVGGQFLLACKVPGKEVYRETIRYFKQGILENGGSIKTSTVFDATDYKDSLDAVIWAAGVAARRPAMEGVDSEWVKTYDEILSGDIPEAKKIAIIGGGGIAVDLAHFLYHDHHEDFYDFWGIDKDLKERGGLKLPERNAPTKEVTIFKRSKGKIGGSLGKTTGWIHRLYLKEKGVRIVEGVQYRQIDGNKLVYQLDNQEISEAFDLIVLCAGQEAIQFDGELSQGTEFYKIGGARIADELDAQRAIEEAYDLAHKI